MPQDGSANYGDFTLEKLDILDRVIDAHTHMSKGAIRNPKNSWIHPVYQYFDMTSGPGVIEMENGGLVKPGSPIIFLQKAYTAGLCFHARFIEKDYETARRLDRNICVQRMASGKTEDSSVCQIVCEDFLTALPRLTILAHHALQPQEKYIGLIYCDTNGTVPPFALIRNAVRQRTFYSVDVLLYLSATNLKRVRRSVTDRAVADLQTELALLGKRKLFVRKPRGAHQWIFVLATNWENCPEFTTMGFRDVQTEEGQRVLSEVCFTYEERALGGLFYPGAKDR